MGDLRSRILERRARFIAAAMTLGASSAGLSCSQAAVCLEPMVDCDAGPISLEAFGPSGVCVGDPVEVVASLRGPCGDTDVTSTTVFATSDPEVLGFEGNKGRARKVGRVVVTALFSGREATATIEVTACDRGDAAPADVSALTDAGAD